MRGRPRDRDDHGLMGAQLDSTPGPAELRWMHDVFGNCVAIARFSSSAAELRFDSTIRLDHSPTNALEFQVEDYARTYPFSYSADEGPDLLRMVERLYLDPGRVVDRWARQFLCQARPPEARSSPPARAPATPQRFAYLRREEPGSQDPVETLRLGSGSCRD